MEFKIPKPLHIGDRIAIVGPSAALATIFPHKRDLGMQRLQSVFGLEPVLYQSASNDRDSSPIARANDLIEAFADPTITAIICTIGGDDLVRIIPFLIDNLICSEPKALLGFSDITALHLLLWKRGIVSYYGGNLMCQFAMGGDMHSYTVNSIQQTLFTSDSQKLLPSVSFLDGQPDWADPGNLLIYPDLEINKDGWQWNTSWDKTVITGRLWGGCIPSIYKVLASGIDVLIPSKDEMKGCVLFIETSDSMPSSSIVYDFIAALGERGLIQCFVALLVGRPQTIHMGLEPPQGRTKFKEDQRISIERGIAEYAPGIPIIFGLDFGHTDPQILVPSGGIVTIDYKKYSIIFNNNKMSKL